MRELYGSKHPLPLAVIQPPDTESPSTKDALGVALSPLETILTDSVLTKVTWTGIIRVVTDIHGPTLHFVRKLTHRMGKRTSGSSWAEVTIVKMLKERTAELWKESC